MYDEEGNLIPPLVAMTRRCIHFIYWEYSFVCKAGIHMIGLCQNGGQPCFRGCTMAGGLPCDKAEFMNLQVSRMMLRETDAMIICELLHIFIRKASEYLMKH